MVAYLKRLSADRPTHLISFEKSDDWANVTEGDVSASGMVWHPQGCHKRLTAVAMAWDIASGMRLGLSLALCHFLRIAHARSYVLLVMARLPILGERGRLAALEAQARQLSIKASVFMPGFVKDTSSSYHHADLHMLSSTGEGLPTVIIEALSAGTPVVSTDCPSGPREILSDGKFGHLVPMSDAVALAAAMADLLAATHNTAALKARAQDFSIDKAVDRYEALLFPGQDRPETVGGINA